VAKGKTEDAVTFCAYLLPRREAVWWACRCARTPLNKIAEDRAAGLLAAEAWVEEPDDERRQVALDIGTRGHCDDPLTWVALAAGWTGGLLVSGPQRPIPMPPIHDRAGHVHGDPDQCAKREPGSAPGLSGSLHRRRRQACGTRTMRIDGEEEHGRA